MALRLQSFDHAFTEAGTYNGFIEFGNTVNVADISLKGFESKYNDTDYYIKSIAFRIYNVNIDTTTTRVNFSLQFEQKDVNGTDTEGSITILAIADVDASTVGAYKEPVFSIKKAD